MKGIIALTTLAILLSGCSIKTREQRAMEEHKQFSQESRALLEAGLDQSGAREYYSSNYGKTHDLQGFIRLKKAQQAKESEAKRAQFDQDYPLLLKRTKACVMRNDFLSEKELPIVAKRCFPDGHNYGRTPYAWRDEVINKATADLSPHFDQVRAQMKAEARQRAAEDRQQAAQDKRDREAEAKRAYDNSLRSLVE